MCLALAAKHSVIMADQSIEGTIRRCVREEIRNIQGSAGNRNGIQTLLDRTRSLIRGAASSTGRELANNPQLANMPSDESSGSRPAKRQTLSHVPGHPYRLQTKRKKTTGSKAPVVPIPKSVHLFEAKDRDEGDEEDDDECEMSLGNQTAIVKGQFDLIPGQTENEIRAELVSVFQTKLPLILKSDFDFVKRERNSIARPAVKMGHQWDFSHVKNLCGQGKLYAQLNVPSDEILRRGNEDDDDEFSRSPFETSTKTDAGVASNSSSPDIVCTFSLQQTSIKNPVPVQSDPGPSARSSPGSSSWNELGPSTRPDPGPSTSTDPVPSARYAPSTTGLGNAHRRLRPPFTCAPAPLQSQTMFATQVQELQSIFPNVPEHELRSALRIYQSVPAAAEAVTDVFPGDSMSSTATTTTPEVSENPASASEIIRYLKNRMTEGSEKLRVDNEDLVTDVLHYYKDPNFDPKKKIRICLNGQLAIDTGGVLRQVFTDVFSGLSENAKGLALFKGAPTRKVPLFSNMHVLSGIFEVIGKMIAHSLLQDGPGFPYLAPIIYSYISSGDLSSAVMKASILDVKDQEPLSNYIDKIRDADEEELNSLNTEPDFNHLMMECGERRLLTSSNKLDIAQSLITYHVLTKNVALLDQIRKGLSILGVLKEIEKYPHLFEHFFVHKGNKLTPAYVKGLLNISVNEADDSEAAQLCSQFLNSYFESCTEEQLSHFLTFVTGTGYETSALVPGSIKVSFRNTDTIYTSTCLMEIKIPIHFKSQAQFNTAFAAVIQGQAFNTH